MDMSETMKRNAENVESCRNDKEGMRFLFAPDLIRSKKGKGDINA